MTTPPASPSPSAAPADSATFARGLARKVVVATLFGGLVFAAMVLYGEVDDLRHAAKSFDTTAVALGFGLAAANYVLRIIRWQYYLGCIGVSLPWLESSLIFLSGFVMSVTPGKVGEVFKSLLLYESRSVSMVRSAPIVVAERLTDLIALVLLTAVGALAFEHGWLIAAAGGAVVSAILAVCAYRPLGELLLRVVSKLPVLSKLSTKLHDAYEALLSMLRPSGLLYGTLIALVAWGMECGSLYVIVNGFPNVHLDWDASVFAYAASTVVGALAMMPGGLGVTDVGMTGLLRALGGDAVTPAIATATTILVRLATLWFAVGVGLLAFAAYKLRRSQSR